MLQDLTKVWGDHLADVILSIAFHWLHTARNEAYLYESWAPGKLLPYSDSITESEMTELFNALIEVSDWRKSFFQARIARLPENEVLSFDASQIASDVVGMSGEALGQEGAYQKQIGLIVLMGRHTKMPVLFRVLPGNITDVTTVTEMLFHFDEITESKRVFAAVLDEGYCSLANIAKFIDQGNRIIMPSEIGSEWMRSSIDKVMPNLRMSKYRITGKDCCGCTVTVEKIFDDGKSRTFRVHIYRNEARSYNENKVFTKSLRSSKNSGWATVLRMILRGN